MLAAGGAAVAASTDNAAATHNPGLLGLHERYDFHGHVLYGPTRGIQWAASVVDGRTSSAFAAGLVYAGDLSHPALSVDELPGWAPPGAEIPNMKRYHDITAALSIPVADRRLSFGVNGTLSIFQHDREGSGTSGNMDVGIGARPVDWLVLGAAGSSLLPQNTLGDRPPTVAGGVRVRDPELGHLEADVTWVSEVVADRLPLVLAGGGEVQIRTAFLAAGTRIDGPEERTDLTWGVGLGSPTGSFEYGMAIPLNLGEDTVSNILYQLSIRFAAPAPIEEPR